MQRAYETVVSKDVAINYRIQYEKAYPAVIVLVQKSNQLTSTETQFVVHGRLEVKLDAVNIAWRRVIDHSCCWH